MGGRPLVGHAAWAGELVADRVVVSTDDDEVAEAAAYYVGAKRFERHRRPRDLAGPTAQIEDAILHWLHRQKPVLADADVIALLQPTSPMRTPQTVRECVRLVAEEGYDSALTVCLNPRRTGRHRSHVDGVARCIWNSPPGFRPRSQDGGPGRQRPEENGCVYAFSVEHFRRTRLRMGGKEAVVVTSWLEALEIDTPQDLAVARALWDAGVVE